MQLYKHPKTSDEARDQNYQPVGGNARILIFGRFSLFSATSAYLTGCRCSLLGFLPYERDWGRYLPARICSLMVSPLSLREGRSSFAHLLRVPPCSSAVSLPLEVSCPSLLTTHFPPISPHHLHWDVRVVYWTLLCFASSSHPLCLMMFVFLGPGFCLQLP